MGSQQWMPKGRHWEQSKSSKMQGSEWASGVGIRAGAGTGAGAIALREHHVHGVEYSCWSARVSCPGSASPQCCLAPAAGQRESPSAPSQHPKYQWILTFFSCQITTAKLLGRNINFIPGWTVSNWIKKINSTSVKPSQVHRKAAMDVSLQLCPIPPCPLSQFPPAHWDSISYHYQTCLCVYSPHGYIY